jgi:hypothetical protein
MPQGLIALGALALALLIGLGAQTLALRKAHQQLGAAQADEAVCRAANEGNLEQLRAAERDLQAAIGESNVIETELMADRDRSAAQAARLSRDRADLQARLAAVLAGNICGAEPVPAAAVDGLREAADRARRAGRDPDPPVGADSG